MVHQRHASNPASNELLLTEDICYPDLFAFVLEDVHGFQEQYLLTVS